LLSSLPVRAVYVTHDQSEAFAIARRVAIMRAGRITQVGTREEVLERPRSGWLARFLGHRNLYSGDALASVPGAPRADTVLLRVDLTSLLPADTGAPPAQGAAADDGTVTSATVLRSRRDGLRWQLDLTLPTWSLELSWEGYARELHDPPAEGDELRIHVPGDAWLPLEEA